MWLKRTAATIAATLVSQARQGAVGLSVGERSFEAELISISAPTQKIIISANSPTCEFLCQGEPKKHPQRKEASVTDSESIRGGVRSPEWVPRRKGQELFLTKMHNLKARLVS